MTPNSINYAYIIDYLIKFAGPSLLGVIAYILKKYSDKLDSKLEKHDAKLEKHETKLAVHDIEIENIKEKIKED